MKQAVTEIAQLTDAPLAIDTSDAAALEAGLRAYHGRALINSVSAEDARIRDFLPLAKKYGAAILCLPITEDGVPKTAEARLKTVQFIISKAKEAGLKDGDFLLDALVMTVSADKDACREVLRTLQLYRQHLATRPPWVFPISPLACRTARSSTAPSLPCASPPVSMRPS